MYIIIFIIAAVIGLILIAIFKESGFGDEEKLPYKKKSYFFTLNERKFYEILKEVAKELNYELFSKVRWADIIYSDRKGKEWMSAWGKIKSKHVDFLLCDRENYSPKIIIELDDHTHLKQERVIRDDFQTETFITAGLKVVRFRPQEDYSKEEIKSKVC